jgi:hypothetical protein
VLASSKREFFISPNNFGKKGFRMKSFRFLAAALIAGLAFAPSAHATSVIDLSGVSGGSGYYTAISTSGGYVYFGVAPGSSVLDTLSGNLAPDKEITISYTYLNLSPTYVGATVNGSNGTVGPTASVGALDGSGFVPLTTDPVTVTALPIIVTAGLGPVSGTTVIENLSSTLSATFSSAFQAVATTGPGELVVSYNETSVPLPPAFLLFATGLAALAAFGAYKKVKNVA